ncbi:hypothetical protein [Streptomyces sp. NPDC053048]
MSDPTHADVCLIHETHWCTCGTFQRYLDTARDDSEPAEDSGE